MSYEAWGDGDDRDYDHLLEAGWWDDQQVKEVTEAIEALTKTPPYESGQMCNGVEFLMRMTMLRVAAGLDVPEEAKEEAERYFAIAAERTEKEGDTMPNCELCGEPMPAGEEMFKLHGYSGPCPKPPKSKAKTPDFAAIARRFAETNTMLRKILDRIPVGVLAHAKQAAGYGDADLSLNDPRLDEAWLQFISTQPKEQQ